MGVGGPGERQGAEHLPEEVRRRWVGRLPSRQLPVAYFAFGHLCLILAFAIVAWNPWGVMGFFYHARILAVVHLITLGWITSSIFGALYFLVPLALQGRLSAGRGDLWSFGAVAVGISGMVAHFWLDSPSGMAWSAGLLLIGFVLPVKKILGALLAAKVEAGVKLHLVFAFLNLMLAGAMGLLIGIDKVEHFLPGHIHARVFAHAHLAAVGWATLMVVAVGYRLLPMLLPSALPQGPSILLGAVLLESGVLGLFVTLLLGGGFPVLPFAGLTVAGLSIFFYWLRFMLLHRRRPPQARPRLDPGLFHVAQGFAYLVVTVVLGCVLAVVPSSTWSLGAVMVYGVTAFLGFLAQLILGIAPRILSILSWLWASAQDSFRESPESPFAMPSRLLQWVVLGLWSVGVPGLAAGLALDLVPLVRSAAGWLLFAALLEAINFHRIVRHSWPARSRE
ncbi:MAG: hypothetical protein KDD47_01690 [Acidobacteria bacterium]|nr:hypothetical protein [Acidobacteriota bacterium]